MCIRARWGVGVVEFPVLKLSCSKQIFLILIYKTALLFLFSSAVCKIYSEQKAVRVKRVVDKKKM